MIANETNIQQNTKEEELNNYVYITVRPSTIDNTHSVWSADKRSNHDMM